MERRTGAIDDAMAHRARPDVLSARAAPPDPAQDEVSPRALAIDERAPEPTRAGPSANLIMLWLLLPLVAVVLYGLLNR